MKVHRVRLSDDEIKIIAEALRALIREKDQEGVGYSEVRPVMNLAHRFDEWGREEPYQDRPYYARRRR